MRTWSEKQISILLQISICVVVLFAIVFVNMNTISYAQDKDETKQIADELAATTEKVITYKWIVDNDKIYCLDDSNERLTGINYVENGFRYFDENGCLVIGWSKIADKTFYFDPNKMGLMLTGEQYIDGEKYNFLPTGELITGFYTTDKGTFYHDSFGYDQVGLIYYNGKNYYVDSESGLKVGKFELDHTYYTDSKGAILKGDCIVDGKSTHFSEDGKFIYGWLKDETGFYYQESDSVRYTSGKKTIDGVDYYFENGYLVTNQVVGMYQADNVGRLKRMPLTTDNLNAALDEILEVTGNDITSIGEYVRTHHAYRYRDKMSSREEMAVYALNNRYISCYYYEALTGLLLERAGYEVITVAGKGFVYAEHYWSLVKTTRNGITGYYHVDSLKRKYIRTDSEMVADGFKWPHENYPATP